MTRYLLPLAMAVLVGACGSPSDEGQSAAQPGSQSGAQSGQASGTGNADPSKVPTPAGFGSTYSTFKIEACDKLTEELEEGSYITYRCPGFGNTALFVQDGDGRLDLDAGIDDGGFQSIGAFNNIGETIEWRLDGDRPVAVIFRYAEASEQGAGHTVLAVETVGRKGAPGCRVAQIDGKTADANQLARDAADAAAADGFTCPERPAFTGNAS